MLSVLRYYKSPEFLSPFTHVFSSRSLFPTGVGSAPQKRKRWRVRTNRMEKGERKRGVDFQRNFRIHPPSAAHRTTS